jgi:holo-[acyl-carrier protein] synthase
MIIGIGIDIAEVSRIKELNARHGRRFHGRILTDNEIDDLASRADSAAYLSGRWAIKEAVFKALGTGWAHGVHFRQIEVRNNDFGKPELILTGRAKDVADALGVVKYHISISHDIHFATGLCIFEA